LVDSIVWFGIGITIGICIGANRVSISRQRLYYQNQIKSKDKEIELITDKLEKCQKWSKVISEENRELRKDTKINPNCYWGG
jgi:hypothetical protein